MQQPSIFSRIASGEIPCHKIYEDEKTLAFLDIHPVQPGHTLIVPKLQIDRLEDLPDDYYVALMHTVKKVASRVIDIYGTSYRACVKVEGFDVQHAHVHVIPCRTASDFHAVQDTTKEPDHEALAQIAQKIAF